jgi:hypothetical protein
MASYDTSTEQEDASESMHKFEALFLELKAISSPPEIVSTVERAIENEKHLSCTLLAASVHVISSHMKQEEMLKIFEESIKRLKIRVEEILKGCREREESLVVSLMLAKIESAELSEQLAAAKREIDALKTAQAK